MKPIPKTIPFKCPKDIYDEIKKCGYFPSTKFILPEDKVEFVSEEINAERCANNHNIPKEWENLKDKNNGSSWSYLAKYYGKECPKCNTTFNHVFPEEKYGTHKATPIGFNQVWERSEYGDNWGFSSKEYDNELKCICEKWNSVSNKLYNWIKENFKGNFIMNRLENKKG